MDEQTLHYFLGILLSEKNLEIISNEESPRDVDTAFEWKEQGVNFRSFMVGWQLLESALDPSRFRGDTADVSAPLAPQALETGDFGIVEPIL